MVFPVAGVPEVPDGNKGKTTRFEVIYHLLENENLVFPVANMVKDGDTENGIESTEFFPG